jgi:hypothetical protein
MQRRILLLVCLLLWAVAPALAQDAPEIDDEPRTPELIETDDIFSDERITFGITSDAPFELDYRDNQYDIRIEAGDSTAQIYIAMPELLVGLEVTSDMTLEEARDTIIAILGEQGGYEFQAIGALTLDNERPNFFVEYTFFEGDNEGYFVLIDVDGQFVGIDSNVDVSNSDVSINKPWVDTIANSFAFTGEVSTGETTSETPSGELETYTLEGITFEYLGNAETEEIGGIYAIGYGDVTLNIFSPDTFAIALGLDETSEREAYRQSLVSLINDFALSGEGTFTVDDLQLYALLNGRILETLIYEIPDTGNPARAYLLPLDNGRFTVVDVFAKDADLLTGVEVTTVLESLTLAPPSASESDTSDDTDAGAMPTEGDFPIADVALTETITGDGVAFMVPEGTDVGREDQEDGSYFEMYIVMDESDSSARILLGGNDFARLITGTNDGDDMATTMEAFIGFFNQGAEEDQQLSMDDVVTGMIGDYNVMAFNYDVFTQGYFLIVEIESDFFVIFDTNEEELPEAQIALVNAIANTLVLSDEPLNVGDDVDAPADADEPASPADADEPADADDGADAPAGRSDDDAVGLVELGAPNIELVNNYAFESGMNVGYPNQWDILSKTDTVTILMHEDAVAFIQLYDLGALFGGTDLGFDFIKQTYGDGAATAWQDDDFDPATSFEDVSINGNPAAIYTFLGQQNGEESTVWLYLIDFGEGNYGMVQAYAIGDQPDTYKLDVQAVAVSMRPE